MKIYYSYFKLKFISSLQYRASALGALFTQLFFGIVNIFIYVAFFKSGTNSSTLTLQETITYIWLTQSFFALIYQFYKDPELFELVRSGNISYELARPTNIYFMWYFKILATRLAAVLLRMFPILIVSILLPKPYNLLAPSSISNFILFVISLTLGSLLIASLSTLYPIIVLKTLKEKGVVNLFSAVSDILSGVAIPIPFFPGILAFVSRLLPFQYVSDVPFRIYLGRICGSELVVSMLMQLIWIFLIILIGYILLNKSLKRVCVQGG